MPKLISLRNDYPGIEREFVENNTFVDIANERYTRVYIAVIQYGRPWHGYCQDRSERTDGVRGHGNLMMPAQELFSETSENK